jgi:peptidyl-dipeptidase Dcp
MSKKATLNLNTEQTTLLDEKYKSFLEGANLAEDKKNKLREIDKELSKTNVWRKCISRNSGFELHITNDEDLSGLPEPIEAARSLAKSQEKGWIFTLDYPSYVPFVTYADNRDYARRWLFFLAKGFKTMN